MSITHMTSSRLPGTKKIEMHGGELTAPLRAVHRVIQKLDTGVYVTEPTKCLCGADDDVVLTEFDKFMMPHRMVLCNECCLIRANPRMTEESYNRFYNDEYLPIYDGFEFAGREYNNEVVFKKQEDSGTTILTFLQQLEDIDLDKVKTVLDFGGGKGGTSSVFQRIGCEVLNVDINNADREYAISRGIPSVKSIEEVPAGFKADLILLVDVIEHLINLADIKKLSTLLAPGGYIFIYTPGLFYVPPYKLFQNAHTYQFIGDTLEYYMIMMGFSPLFVNEQIFSLWTNNYEDARFLDKPKMWKRYILEHLAQAEKRLLPPIRTRSKFSTKSMFSNLEENLKLKLPEFSALQGTASGPIMIIGAGPSVDGQLDKIRELRQQGVKLLSIDRMYPWCMANNLEPDFTAILDAGDDIVDGLTNISNNTVHLLTANVHPDTVNILKNYKCYFVAGGMSIYPEARDAWTKNGYTKITVVGTGGSVVLSSLYISLVMGFRNIHLFGFDCMVPSTTYTYSKGVAGKGVDRQYCQVEVGDEVITTCTSFLAFAQQFFKMIEVSRQWGMIDSIDVHGESLINKMANLSELGKEEVVNG